MIYEELSRIQKELKAPKGQFNKFGNYKYRSCEDILEAVKPLLGKCCLTISDDIVLIGDRFYVKATAKLALSNDDYIENSALAREALDKKGMDESQITGASSSYARKYALNGLFAIDDTKDADATNTHGKDDFEKDAANEMRVNTIARKKGEKSEPKGTLEERYTKACYYLMSNDGKGYKRSVIDSLNNLYNDLINAGEKEKAEDLKVGIDRIIPLDDGIVY
jgi:hypothetical protein